jgi:hypothetical protein
MPEPTTIQAVKWLIQVDKTPVFGELGGKWLRGHRMDAERAKCARKSREVWHTDC